MKLTLEILPEDLKTVKVLRYRKGTYYSVNITMPPDVCDRYNLQNHDQIVIAFIRKVEQPKNH